MDERDELTKELFNGKVTFEQDNGDEGYSINGYKVDSFVAAKFTGAPDGSTIKMSGFDDDHLTFTVDHQFFATPAVWEVYRFEGDSTFSRSWKSNIELKPEHQNKGYGIRMFATEAQTAKALKIEEIWLGAADSQDGKKYNGHYTWPRYGFEAELTNAEVLTLPHQLYGAADVADLMKTEFGRIWWKKYGTWRIMSFQVQNESHLERLRLYCDEKKVRT